jgi:hypothetical protein
MAALARMWTPARGRRHRPESMLGDFDDFVAALVPEPDAAEVPVPEDPAIALRNVRELMDTVARHALPDLKKWDHARALAEHAGQLVAPVLGRNVAYTEFALACARLALVTAAALMLEQNRPDVAGHLLEAVRGLVALRERAAGDLTPNEVLILVRI